MYTDNACCGHISVTSWDFWLKVWWAGLTFTKWKRKISQNHQIEQRKNTHTLDLEDFWLSANKSTVNYPNRVTSSQISLKLMWVLQMWNAFKLHSKNANAVNLSYWSIVTRSHFPNKSAMLRFEHWFHRLKTNILTIRLRAYICSCLAVCKCLKVCICVCIYKYQQI